jgi:hypothetical protein
MKNLRFVFLFVLLLLIHRQAPAQTQQAPVNQPDLNKPKLFNGLPASVAVNTQTLDNLLRSSTGLVVNLNLSADLSALPLDGQVLSSSSADGGNLQTATLRANNYNGAVLYISKVMLPGGDIKYNARIIDRRFGDAYILELKNNQYYFTKKNYYDVINE